MFYKSWELHQTHVQKFQGEIFLTKFCKQIYMQLPLQQMGHKVTKTLHINSYGFS